MAPTRSASKTKPSVPVALFLQARALFGGLGSGECGLCTKQRGVGALASRDRAFVCALLKVGCVGGPGLLRGWQIVDLPQIVDRFLVLIATHLCLIARVLAGVLAGLTTVKSCLVVVEHARVLVVFVAGVAAADVQARLIVLGAGLGAVAE